MVFEKLKETLKKRIEDNSCKSELTYKDREGVEHTEVVYMKRTKGKFSDWHQTFPPVRDDGSNKWDVKNALFGGTKNFIRTLLKVGFVVIVILAIKEAYSNYEALANLPCVKNCLLNLNLK